MRRASTLAIALLASLMLAGTSLAGTYSFTPDPPDVYDLNHDYAYRWGVGFDVPENETIIGASISFDNIYNNTSGGSDLWVTLLPDGNAGQIDGYYDGQNSSNYFASASGAVEVLHEEDINHWWNPEDITHYFTTSELAALTNYLAADGVIGIGIDPDCHLKNDGVEFIIKTKTDETPVPEPATLILLCTGLVGIVGLRRMRRK